MKCEQVTGANALHAALRLRRSLGCHIPSVPQFWRSAEMEKFIQIVVYTLFGAGGASWVGMMAFWTAAALCLTPKAQDRFWWNPYNGTFNKDNLTERGQWFRRLAIRCLILFVIFPSSGMIVGVILMLAFGIQVDSQLPSQEDKKVDRASSVLLQPKQEAEQAVDGNPH